jgi:hypothetical protein
MANITGTALLGSTALTPDLNEIPLVSAPASQAIGMATGNIASRLIRPRRAEEDLRNASGIEPDLSPLDDSATAKEPPSIERMAKNPSTSTFYR